MTSLTVQIKALHPALGKTIAWPKQMTEQAAGFDVCAAIDAPVVLAPGQRRLISCGFSLAMPHGFEAQIRPRSGLALRHGVTCLNAPGTLDADYRGEVGVLLINHGEAPFSIEPGLRIAQLVFAAVAKASLLVVEDLDTTARGAGGFGSTGV